MGEQPSASIISSSGERTSDDGLVKAKITPSDVEKMRRRIGFPNPTLRRGLSTPPWNPKASASSIRRWAHCLGDDNPLYVDPAYAAKSRWKGPVAPPGFEWSMGFDRVRPVPDELAQETRSALRGVQLYHSGAEYYFHRPILPEVTLFRSEWVSNVEKKTSKFAQKSVLVTNSTCMWDPSETVYVTSDRWFVHAERRAVVETPSKPKAPSREYSEEEWKAIEADYDNEFRRGAQPLYFEDLQAGSELPRMVKGPLTITDMINTYMGAGWLTYGNWPFRLAYENRKLLRGFYTKNEFGVWDTIQRVHWDVGLAHQVGVPQMYDIGPMRYLMLCHYLTNYAGDDAWVYRARYELRNFNYVGDTTWLSGTVSDVGVDNRLGAFAKLDIRGINQRGEENMRADATLLLPSRARGAVQFPPTPTVTEFRSTEPPTASELLF